MADLGCLFVYTSVLIASHTVNNVDFGGEPEDEGYESEV